MLLLGSVGLPGVGSNLLVLVIYLKLPRPRLLVLVIYLRNPARLLLLHVSLGDLLPPVLRAALAFSFALRGSRVGSTTIGEWASATACEVSDPGGPPSRSCSRPRPLPLRVSASRRGSPDFTSPLTSIPLTSPPAQPRLLSGDLTFPPSHPLRPPLLPR